MATQMKKRRKTSCESFPRFSVRLVRIITPSPRSLHVFRISRIVPELFTDIFNMYHNGAVPHRVVIPNGGVDLIQGENTLAVRYQKLKDLIFRVGKRNGSAILNHALAVRIQIQITECQQIRFRASVPSPDTGGQPPFINLPPPSLPASLWNPASVNQVPLFYF